MTCLEQLQQDVSDILAQLRNADPCCSENITYYDSDTYITIIVPGVGEPPEFYGETEVEDWEEWKQYLCYNAHLWVDELIRAALTIGVALDTGGLTIGLLAAVISAIALFVVGGVLALPLLMVIIFGLSANVAATIFEDAAVDIENARDAIVCVIVQGGDVASVIEAVVSSGVAWETLYSFFDYDSAMAILYEGGNGDDVYLEAEKRFDCCPDNWTLYIEEWPQGGPHGTVVDQTHIQGQLLSSCWRVCQLSVWDTALDQRVRYKIVSVGMVTSGCVTGGNSYVCLNHLGQNIYDSDTPPSNLEDVSYMCINSSAPFTVEIIWEPMFVT
jgi:hypothetical protein